MPHHHPINEFKLFLRVQKQCSPHTLSGYIRDIHQFFDLTTPNNIASVDETTISNYLNQLHQRNVSPQSLYRKLVSLNQFWQFLCKKKTVPRNPWVNIRRPKLHRYLPVFIEEHTMLELLNHYPNKRPADIRNKAILELLFASGIRVSELVQLTPRCIQLDQNECRVIGKGNKERIAIFGDRASHAISMYLLNVRPLWRTSASSALFISTRGTTLTTRSIQRIVRDANQYHTSPIQLTPHACRHTCANLLMGHGAGIREVQEFLGHTSIATTERYTHIPTNKLKKRFLDAIDAPVAETD
ncbi:MAG: tyrosine-type recombinase/integrase [Candidatus Marinamargulisbacteria bacterium]